MRSGPRKSSNSPVVGALWTVLVPAVLACGTAARPASAQADPTRQADPTAPAEPRPPVKVAPPARPADPDQPANPARPVLPAQPLLPGRVLRPAVPARPLPLPAPVPGGAAERPAPPAPAGKLPDDEGGLAGAREALARLLPLTIAGGKLAIDRESWDKNKPKEPDDPAERLKFRRGKLAERYGAAADKWPEATVDRMWTSNFDKPGALTAFEDILPGLIGSAGGSTSISGTRRTMSRSGNRGEARISIDTTGAAGEFSLLLREKTGRRREVDLEDDGEGSFTLTVRCRATQEILIFTQTAGGAVQLVRVKGDKVDALTAAGLSELLRKAPKQTEAMLFGPLEELGIRSPLHDRRPLVAEVACTAFGKVDPALEAKVAGLLKGLASDDFAERERSTVELGKVFAPAVKLIVEAHAATTDPEVKSRLSLLSAQHAELLRAREYVAALKLHEDRAYLLSVMAEMPDLKDAARRRLTEVVGRDHGPDPAAWPAK